MKDGMEIGTFDVEETTFKMLEEMKRTYKTHRNIGEIEGKYIKQELETSLQN